MNIIERNILFADEELTLTNQRALFWKKKDMLILSDLHLGKAAHFRKNGIALSTEVALQDLQRLEKLIRYYHAKEVIVVGDLIHAGNNREVTLFKAFTILFHDVKFTLIKGNHDRLSEKQFQELGIDAIHTWFQISGITLAHQPLATNPGFEITGHIHPGIRIKMPAGGYMKFPCFIVTATAIILPAFSRFTGLDTTGLTGPVTYYAIAEEGIFEINQFV